MANTSEESTEMDFFQNYTYFDCLPDEIVFDIVSDVPRRKFHELIKVSPRFGRICCDERYWGKVDATEETIDFYEFEQMIAGQWSITEVDLTAAKVRSSKVRNPNLRVSLDKLNISRVSPDVTADWKSACFQPAFLEAALVTACEPKELIMNGAKLTSHLADAIADCTELQVLGMERTEFCDNGDLTSSSLMRMIKSFASLKELNMSFSKVTLFDWFIVCRDLSINLEKLFLNHVSFVNPWLPTYEGRERLKEEVSEFISNLLNRMENLRQLGLSLDYLARPMVIRQVINLPCLEELHFCKCDFGGPKRNLVSAIMDMPNLKRLNFAMKCPLQEEEEEENIESWQKDVKDWSKKIPCKDTTITFSESECVIELFEYKGLKC